MSIIGNSEIGNTTFVLIEEDNGFACDEVGSLHGTNYLPRKAVLNYFNETWLKLFGCVSEEYVAGLLTRLIRMKTRQAFLLLYENNGDVEAACEVIRARVRDANQRRRDANKKLKKHYRIPPLTRHHDLARCRQGKDHPENLFLLNRDRHDVWHKLFKLATIKELLGILQGGAVRQAA